MSDLTHGLRLHPSYSPTQACETLVCKWRYWALSACKTSRCPHRWQREDAEDRAKREADKSVGLHAHAPEGRDAT